ncbi:bsl5473 [Bradyrhizobium diazoefficiens USDA 110]|uniref:Bsl5473 protein n=1 Tax=Bradyrhizobium diazoefficiens (strain JCM 10833 / BCRC 13528 / IAM 13628 / NBRC 14792 / USDA 110) TaxID=224911 RepID=Q89J11_BRADU|nr:hypothetical protein CO678_32300 [Bradyrhizobium diazoefficiens]QBP24250.1 hypothetical protein Bdiaspc4_28860 [Bradyrhizobium diazoefficiens]QHP69598.1 hypothetical protein EI171_21300 [Bradyrhizobium sp. LCT2]BAC50738.1 bsl5473 [Bradyrhizobium diazoefficiens USDA 110]
MLAEIEQGIAAEAVDPDAGTGIAVSDSHRDQAHMHAAGVARMQRCGHNLTGNGHRDRAQGVLPAVLAGEDEFRAAADRAR